MRSHTRLLAGLSVCGSIACCYTWGPSTSAAWKSRSTSTLDRHLHRPEDARRILPLARERCPCVSNVINGMSPEDNIEEMMWEERKTDHRPRVKMDEGPIPEYLVDMLRESGDIGLDGKAIDDPDDFDDDIFSDSPRKPQYHEEEEYYDIPFGDMLKDGETGNIGDEGGLMESSIAELAHAYAFPEEFFLDLLSRWGVPPPIDRHCRVGDLIDGEQGYALGEAINGLDPADVRDNYIDESLEDLSEQLGIPLSSLFQVCATNKINLPEGGDTYITVDECKALLAAVAEGGEDSRVWRLFDENRMSNRWVGIRKEAQRGIKTGGMSHEAEPQEPWEVGKGWKNGPLVVGEEEGNIPPELVQIPGKIFGEDLFALSENNEDFGLEAD